MVQPSLGKRQHEKKTSQIPLYVKLLVAFGLGSLVGFEEKTELDRPRLRLQDLDVAKAPQSKGSPSSSSISPSFQLAFDQSYGFFDDISDFNWKLAQKRARHRINHRFPDTSKFYSEAPRWLMNNFEPDFTCGQERRVGGVGDGPKWVCDPHRLPQVAKRRASKAGADPKRAGCLVYSVGCGGKWQFELGLQEMLGNACEVHIFDPGNWAKDHPEYFENDSNWYFHKWGFRSGYDQSYKPVVKYGEFFTLKETMEKLGHTGRVIDVFKIDCEFCEWKSFQDWFEPDVDIRQILVETHSLPAKPKDALDYFYAFQKNHYYMFHKEPNIHPKSGGEGVEWGYIKLHPDFFKNETIAAAKTD